MFLIDQRYNYFILKQIYFEVFWKYFTPSFICVFLLNNLVSRGTFVEHNCNKMEEKKKISRKAGILWVTDLLYNRLSRKEIIEEISKTCEISSKSIDNWMKEAKPAVQERLNHDEIVRQRESDAIITEAVKTHGITKEKLLIRLGQIALGSVKQVFTVDGGLKQISEWDEETAGMIAGIESFDERSRDTGEILGTNRKVKLLSPLEAIAQLSKMLGYNMPDKVANTDGKGNDLPKQVLIVNGKEIEF